MTRSPPPRAQFRKMAAALSAAAGPQSRVSPEDEVTCEPKQILVCGFRAKWNAQHLALRSRIFNLAKGLGPGSNILFLNQKPTRDRTNKVTEETTTGFATIMEQCGFAPAKPSGGAARAAETTWALPDDCPGVTITHRQGDAASPDDLEPVVAEARVISLLTTTNTNTNATHNNATTTTSATSTRASCSARPPTRRSRRTPRTRACSRSCCCSATSSRRR